jgi:hypothetical protein
MLPWRKLCQMIMFLWACHWCLGGFTPDRVWGQEKSAEASPSTGSPSEVKSAQTSPKTDPSGEEYSFWRPSPDYSWRFFATPQELQKYRKSWNPFSHGPILANSPDVQPQNQWLVQFFLFSAFGDKKFPNQLTTSSEPAAINLMAASPTLFIGYGITDNIEVDLVPSLIMYDAKPNSAFSGTPTLPNVSSGGHGATSKSEFGLGDTAIYLKWRIRVQDPDTWHPTFTNYFQVTLPTSEWAGTDPIPGGFSPLGRLPATKFGGLGLTEGLMFRKNIEPFRFMASAYYTYTAPGSTTTPGSTESHNTYNGDIVNTRLIAEWIADSKRGLGFAMEFLSVHGLPFRLDGHDLNLNPTSFSLIGVEPSVQYTVFHDESGGLAVAAGAIFTIAGQNNLDAIYPNISMYYFWSKKGAPLMR